MKKFFSSGQFWAPYEDGNQKEPFPKKCWKWCLFMLQKYHGLFEKKTFFYIDEQSKTFFLCFLFFFAELLHITFFCFKEISVITTDKKVVFWKLLQKSAVNKSDKNGFAVWAQNSFIAVAGSPINNDKTYGQTFSKIGFVHAYYFF